MSVSGPIVPCCVSASGRSCRSVFVGGANGAVLSVPGSPVVFFLFFLYLPTVSSRSQACRRLFCRGANRVDFSISEEPNAPSCLFQSRHVTVFVYVGLHRYERISNQILEKEDVRLFDEVCFKEVTTIKNQRQCVQVSDSVWFGK